MNYLLTVIVPIYNVQQYLRRCLDSLISQKYDNIEIILVDDGSTDDSSILAKEYANSYKNKISYYRKENGGLSDARNYGVKKANGDYITFVDSDDYVDLNLYLKAMQILNTKMYDVLCFDIKYHYGRKTKIFNSQIIENNFKDYMIKSPNAVNKIIKKVCWDLSNISFPINLWYEDVATIPVLACYVKSIVYLPNVYYNYMQNSNSISNQKKYNEKFFDCLKSLDYLNDLVSKSGNKTFDKEVEFLYILHCLYLGTQRVVEFKDKTGFNYIIKEVSEKFPNWKDNKHLKSINVIKRLYLKSIEKNNFYLCYILVFLRKVVKI